MKKILIVDDSAFTRGIHKDILTSGGYETVEAASGTEALEVFEKEKPDLTVVDLLMPDMDGMDVIRKLLESDPGAKIVVCSTDKQKPRQEEAREIGALGFLAKPIDDEELVRTFNDILS